MASDSTRIVGKQVRVIFPDGLPRGLDPSQVQLVVRSKADAPVREPAPQPVQPSECSAGPDIGSPALPPNEPEPVAAGACPATPPPAQGEPQPSATTPESQAASGPEAPGKSRAEAARENGRKSHGPVTPEGKARSSRNALKHGLSSRRIVIGTEEEEEWREFRDECHETLKPIGAIELGYADEFAASRWRLQRCLGIETSIFDYQFAMQKIYDEKKCANMDGVDKTGMAFKSAKDDLTALGRYETRIRRSGERAFANLLKFQSIRQNEPNPPDEPETPDGDMRQLVASRGESPAQNEPRAPAVGDAPSVAVGACPPAETPQAKRTQATGHNSAVPLPSAFCILHSSSADSLVREPAPQPVQPSATSASAPPNEPENPATPDDSTEPTPAEAPPASAHKNESLYDRLTDFSRP